MQTLSPTPAAHDNYDVGIKNLDNIKYLNDRVMELTRENDTK